MPTMKRVQNRLLLLAIFALACFRIVARVLPMSRTARAAERSALRKGIEQGVRIRAAGAGGRTYALQAAGRFPYVKVSLATPARAVPVPVEVASLSPTTTQRSARPSEVCVEDPDAAVAGHGNPRLIEECCTDCTDCSDCADCTDCTCSCTDCTDCTDCTG
jgi:hypothetical protein